MHFGELVQLDGSFHEWFEDRGPRACAMTMVDDATGRTQLRFGAEETIWAAAGILQRWIARYGVPRALYTDWKNLYLRAPTTNERARGDVPLTQFGRMCTKLGILLIGAASPQAKGRVERGHGTHQDRLIKKLRLKGIHDIAAANAYVEAEYLAAHNTRFAVAPASPVDHHEVRNRQRWADADVFCLETTRLVGNDHVIQYDHLPPPPPRPNDSCRYPIIHGVCSMSAGSSRRRSAKPGARSWGRQPSLRSGCRPQLPLTNKPRI